MTKQSDFKKVGVFLDHLNSRWIDYSSFKIVKPSGVHGQGQPLKYILTENHLEITSENNYIDLDDVDCFPEEYSITFNNIGGIHLYHIKSGELPSEKIRFGSQTYPWAVTVFDNIMKKIQPGQLSLVDSYGIPYHNIFDYDDMYERGQFMNLWRQYLNQEVTEDQFLTMMSLMT